MPKEEKISKQIPGAFVMRNIAEFDVHDSDLESIIDTKV